jgi:hypothetical protein
MGTPPAEATDSRQTTKGGFRQSPLEDLPIRPREIID